MLPQSKLRSHRLDQLGYSEPSYTSFTQLHTSINDYLHKRADKSSKQNSGMARGNKHLVKLLWACSNSLRSITFRASSKFLRSITFRASSKFLRGTTFHAGSKILRGIGMFYAGSDFMRNSGISTMMSAIYCMRGAEEAYWTIDLFLFWSSLISGNKHGNFCSDSQGEFNSDTGNSFGSFGSPSIFLAYDRRHGSIEFQPVFSTYQHSSRPCLFFLDMHFWQLLRSPLSKEQLWIIFMATFYKWIAYSYGFFSGRQCFCLGKSATQSHSSNQRI